MRKRTIGGLLSMALGLSVAGVVAAPPALAQAVNASSCAPGGSQYPPSQRTLVLDRNNAQRGASLDLAGCASPRAQVNFTMFSHPKPLGSATADAAGFFRASTVVPCDAEEGAHRITAVGEGINSSTAVNVSGDTTLCAAGGQTGGGGTGGTGTGGTGGTGSVVSSDNLPRTGNSSAAPLTAAGIGLVLIGTAAVMAARRRRVAESA